MTEQSAMGLSIKLCLQEESSKRQHESESTHNWLSKRPSTPPSSKVADVFLNNGST